MDLPFITAWLDDLLDPKAFKDYCVNGLCVEASDKVTKVVTGVSLRDQLEDITGMKSAQGILTVRGGMTSHAAVPFSVITWNALIGPTKPAVPIPDPVALFSK